MLDRESGRNWLIIYDQRELKNKLDIIIDERQVMIFDEKQRRGQVINKIKCKVNDLEKVTTYECLNDNNKQ